MKIGIVLYPTYGGSGVVATELGKSLAKLGHQIHFISYSFPVRLDVHDKNIFYHEVRVNSYPLFKYPPYESALTSKLVDVIRFEKLDVLHLHYAIPHASAAHMAQQILQEEGIYIPFITTLHGTDITLVGRDPFFKPIITYSINQSDAVTTVSESLKKDTYKYFNIKNGIDVIPNFICVEDKMFSIKRELYAKDDEFILCHVSNFRKVKRVQDVIRTFAKVRETVNCKLILVGDGPERDNMEMLCRELETCDHTLFTGTLNNTAEILSIADLFLLPSETESFGLAALEAMAVGVPVISTNTGGIPEVNIAGFSGYTSNVGDVEDMAKNALYLLEDKDRLATFKKNAVAQAKKFNVNEVVDKYVKLYKKVINKQSWKKN
ncbi:MAG: N-acetyl-alpha-D-glucosaminyl L-malate synthase BshA [Flavobacteriales bacterium]